MATLGDSTFYEGYQVTMPYGKSTCKMVVIRKTDSQVWLMYVDGGSEYKGWESGIDTKCNDFFKKLDIEVYKKTSSYNGKKVFVLSVDDALSIRVKEITGTSYTNIGYYGAMWTSTYYSSKYAYWIGANGNKVSTRPLSAIKICPVIILPSNFYVNGSTIPPSGKTVVEDATYGVDLPYHDGLVFEYDGGTHFPSLHYNENKVLVTDSPSSNVYYPNDNYPNWSDVVNKLKKSADGLYSLTFKPQDGYFWWGDASGKTRYGISKGEDRPLTLSWEITKLADKPKTSNLVFEYDGKPHFPKFDYNTSKVVASASKTGTYYRDWDTIVEKLQKTNAGTYTVYFKPESSDGKRTGWTPDNWGRTLTKEEQYSTTLASHDVISFSWEIKKPVVTPITFNVAPNKTLTYNGYTQTMTFSGYDSTKMTISGNTGVNAGTYYAIVTLNSGYCWDDGSTSPKEVSWVIGRKPITTVPSQKETLIYTGNSQSPSWNNFSSTELSIGGTLKGTNAGSYPATFTPTSNYCWSDGTYSVKTVNWTIGRKSISSSITQSGKLVYNGSEQTATFDGYDPTTMAIHGNTGTDAGIYTAIITPKAGNEWSDGTISGVSVIWEIQKKDITMPTRIGSPIHQYDGNYYFPDINYGAAENQKWYTVMGDTAARVDAGKYTITFALNDKDNTQWENATITDHHINWVIDRMPVAIPDVSPLSFVYNGEVQAPTITINSGDREYIIQTGTTSAAEITDDGYVIGFELKDTKNYKWSDNTDIKKTFTWYITRIKINKVPSQKGALTYNGNTQAPEWNDYDNKELSLSGVINGVNAETYTAIFTPKEHYCWNDGKNEPKEVSWEIGKMPIVVPSQDGELIYNGEEQSPKWNDYSSNKLDISGDTSGVKAGVYTSVFTPNSNHYWEDGTSTPIEVKWKIKRLQLFPPNQSGTLVYNESMQSPKWDDNYNPRFMTISGVISGIDAGHYSATFECNDSCYFVAEGLLEDTKADVTWKIKRSPTAVPPIIIEDLFEYDGEEHSPIWEDNEIIKKTIRFGGILTATNANKYIATAQPTSNYLWKDGTSDSVKYDWEITRKPIRKDPCLGNKVLEYNGEEQSPECINYPQDYVDGAGLSETDIGDYTATFTIDSNHCWVDGTFSPIKIGWRIDYKKILRPSYEDNLVFNGYEQCPRWLNYNQNEIDMSGDKNGVHAEEYATTFTPSDKCQWTDGSREPYTVSWIIDKYHYKYPFQSENMISGNPLAIDENASEYLRYNGKEQEPTLWFGNIYNQDLVKGVPEGVFSVGDTLSETEVGKYFVTLTPNRDYCWEKGETTPYNAPWRIITGKLVTPTPKSEYYYTGETIFPEFNDYYPELMEMSGETYGIRTGNYTACFEIKNKTNYEWESYNTNKWRVGVDWKIENAVILVPFPSQRNILTYNGEYQSPTWDNYNEFAMSLVGGNPGKKEAGTYHAWFTLKDGFLWEDGSQEDYDAKWKILEKEGEFPKDISTATPDDISKVIDEGIPDEIWHIGDKVPIRINGDIGGVKFDNAWFYAYIIGFDHNMSLEGGEKTIHFQFAKLTKNDKEISFTDKKYGKSSAGNSFSMNTADTASGGWRDSYMRNTICRKFYEALPKEWQDIIIHCPKYTDNVGDGSDSESSVTATKDKIFLLSEYECLGKNTNANSSEPNKQAQYDYYKEHGYSRKGKYSAQDEEAVCWLRSPHKTETDKFCTSSYSFNDLCGKSESSLASFSYGFAPCFAVGGRSSDSMGGGFYDDDDPNKPVESLKRVHVPQQINPPYEDGAVKTPEWDEYNNIAIIDLGGEWDGITAGTYSVELALKSGYIWEDDTMENKEVPWVILSVGEPMPEQPAPIVVHIPKQFPIPYYDGTVKIPQWDEWNKYAINIIGGTRQGIIATNYLLKVNLNPGYVWEDGTTEDKTLPWVILPRRTNEGTSDISPDEEEKEVIVEKKFESGNPTSPDDPFFDVEGSIPSAGANSNCCCCCCDNGLFDLLNQKEDCELTYSHNVKVNVSGVNVAARGTDKNDTQWLVIADSGDFSLDHDVKATIWLSGGGCNGDPAVGSGNQWESGVGGDGGSACKIGEFDIAKGQVLTSVVAEVGDKTGTTLIIDGNTYTCTDNGDTSTTGGTNETLTLDGTEKNNKEKQAKVVKYGTREGTSGIETPYGWIGSSGGGGLICANVGRVEHAEGGQGAGDGNGHTSPGTAAANYGCGGGGGSVCIPRCNKGGNGKKGCIVISYVAKQNFCNEGD